MTILALLFLVVYAVTSLTGFAGWIWLVVSGFKRSAGWGLAMLFLSPIAAIVAAVREWSEWKRPFLLYYGSFGAQIVLLVVFFLALPMALPFGQAADAAALEMQAAQLSQPVADGASAGEAVGDAVPADADIASNDAVAESDPVVEPGVEPATVRGRLPMEVVPAEGEAPPTDPTGRPVSASVSNHAADPTVGAQLAESNASVPDGYQEITVATAATRVGARVRVVGRDGRIHKGTLSSVEAGQVRVTVEMTGGSVAMDFGAEEIRSLQVPR